MTDAVNPFEGVNADAMDIIGTLLGKVYQQGDEWEHPACDVWLRMLDVAGVSTIGDRPDWECMATQMQLETAPAGWATTIRGRAVKLLDAHRYPLPQIGDYDLIWLYRDEREQAKSGLKLAASMFSTVKADRREIRAWSAGLRRDAPRAIKALEAAGPPRSMTLRFEHILGDPFMAALSLCRHLGTTPARRARWPARSFPADRSVCPTCSN